PCSRRSNARGNSVLPHERDRGHDRGVGGNKVLEHLHDHVKAAALLVGIQLQRLPEHRKRYVVGGFKSRHCLGRKAPTHHSIEPLEQLKPLVYRHSIVGHCALEHARRNQVVFISWWGVLNQIFVGVGHGGGASLVMTASQVPSIVGGRALSPTIC